MGFSFWPVMLVLDISMNEFNRRRRGWDAMGTFSMHSMYCGTRIGTEFICCKLIDIFRGGMMACFKFHCLQIICTLIKMAYDASRRRRRQLQKSRNAVAAEELTLEINIQLGGKCISYTHITINPHTHTHNAP